MNKGDVGSVAVFRNPDTGLVLARGRHFPRDADAFETMEDIHTVLRRDVFESCGPHEPIFEPDARLVTMGSCFADHLRNALNARQDHKKRHGYIDLPSYLNNPLAVQMFLEWVIVGTVPKGAHDYSFGEIDFTNEEHRLSMLENFKTADGFVITLGLAEVWRDKKTENVYWRGMPKKVVEHDKVAHSVMTVEEAYLSIDSIACLIANNLKVPVIFTLSPIPLNASFRSQSIFQSDCVSKSILRVALDKFMTLSTAPQVYYWPSFEVFRWVGPHTDIKFMGDTRTSRHTNFEIVQIVMDIFFRRFFK